MSFIRTQHVQLHGLTILVRLCVVLYAGSAWPQTQVASIFGSVTDQTSARIMGAQITVSSKNIGLKRVALSDYSGQYRLAGLPPGVYTVRAEKEKFQTEVLEGVALGS